MACKDIIAELNKDLKLDDENYSIWQQKMKFILIEQDTLDFLTKVVNPPPEGGNETAYVAYKKRNDLCQLTLLSTMVNDILVEFSTIEMPKAFGML